MPLASAFPDFFPEEHVLTRLIGSNSPTASLKLGLDASSRAVRDIGHRVANAATPGGSSFDNALRAQQSGGTEEVDLEREMVALADEQLRFEATTRLLQSAYRQIRSSVREG